MNYECPIKKLKTGFFYQVHKKDCDRLATRIFQKYDRDASKNLSTKEIKFILKDIFKGIDKKKQFSNEQAQSFFEYLDKDRDGTITENDFKLLAEEYFVNSSKEGAWDMQTINPELYEINAKSDNKNRMSSAVTRDLKKDAIRRFGDKFVNMSLDFCEKSWTEAGYKTTEKYEFDKIFDLFETMYTKIAYADKNDKLIKDDFMALLKSLDYNEDGLIGYTEYQLYFLKGILGC